MSYFKNGIQKTKYIVVAIISFTLSTIISTWFSNVIINEVFAILNKDIPSDNWLVVLRIIVHAGLFILFLYGITEFIDSRTQK